MALGLAMVDGEANQEDGHAPPEEANPLLSSRRRRWLGVVAAAVIAGVFAMPASDSPPGLASHWPLSAWQVSLASISCRVANRTYAEERRGLVTAFSGAYAAAVRRRRTPTP